MPCPNASQPTARNRVATPWGRVPHNGSNGPPRADPGLVRRARPRAALARPLRVGVVGDGLGVHAAADPGGPGAARARAVGRALADPGRPRGGGHRRGSAGLGAARLPAPGAAAARRRHRDRREPRWRRARRLRRPDRAARRGRLHRGSHRLLRPRPAPRGARHQRAPGPRPDSRRRRAPRPVGHQGGARDRGRVAARGRTDRGHVVGGGHGAGRAGLHGHRPALRRVPRRRPVRVARGRLPGPGPAPIGSAAAG